MSDIDELVKRLSEITDELLALEPDDFETRFALQTEQDELRAKAAEFHQRKDEGRSDEDLRDELSARRAQLAKIQDSFLSRAMQSSGRDAPGSEVAVGGGGDANRAIGKAQGADAIVVRIAELEQELSKRNRGT